MRACVWAALAAVLLAACATPRYQAAPVVIRAAEPLKGAVLQGPDLTLPAEELFRKGHEAYARGLKDDALVYFRAIVQRHPEAPTYLEAAYNAGLLLEREKRYAEAAPLYDLIRRHATSAAKDRADAGFRLLTCQAELKRYAENVALSAQLLAEGGERMAREDRAEAMARRGEALLFLDREDEAATELKAALVVYRAGLRAGDIADERAGAMAYYYLGELEHRAFARTELLVGDPAGMAERMETKARHLLNAQEQFLECIKQDNAFWATAAGLRIGRLYREFYEAINAVPLPANLRPGGDEAQMYQCVLGKRALVLLRKAMRIFDRTLAMAERLRIHNPNVDDTRRALDDVKALYLHETERCQSVLPAEEADPTKSSAP